MFYVYCIESHRVKTLSEIQQEKRRKALLASNSATDTTLQQNAGLITPTIILIDVYTCMRKHI